MISIVWHSTKIEGCSLTETETKVLLEYNLTAGGKPLTDHLMVKDHFEAFLFIKQAAQLKQPFSTKFIQQVNAHVMKHTGSIVKTIKNINNLLSQFCQAVNTRISKVQGNDITKLAADVHYNFVNIHPFSDGNGRTARLLMNYVLMYHNAPLLKMFTEDRTAYINALNETETQGNLAIFRDFIASQYCKFLQLEIDKHKKLNKGFMMMF